MVDINGAFVEIPGVLQADDVEYLKAACRQHLSEARMPCYVLINRLNSRTYLRIKEAVERQMQEPVYYLNDFYMCTDESFKTGWHMDTELYTFARAVNAWILLSPDRVSNPLGFLAGINDDPELRFHSVHVDGDDCIFADYHTGRTAAVPMVRLEARQVRTPEVALGDILAFDPKRFHRTNTSSPKHAIVLKFVMKGPRGFPATQQIDPQLWPEVGLFNILLRNTESWDVFIDGVRRMLATSDGRKQLSAGFYPEKFDFYRRQSMLL
jgi:ectoine hydroxylase-related dioxygenase (phytanoyl-CoA dioxygenase family)